MQRFLTADGLIGTLEVTDEAILPIEEHYDIRPTAFFHSLQ